MKKLNHPASQVFLEIANNLYKNEIQPYKSLKKSERPGNYQKTLERIERNRRFAKDIEERHSKN